MSQSFNATQPIYLQIVQRLCRQVIRGELEAGDKLPSVRDLALQMGVKQSALNNVSLALPRGKIIGLVGPNGTGCYY